MARIVEDSTDRLVIVAGPTFGEAMKLLLFGVAFGAGLVFFIKKDHTPSLVGTQSFYDEEENLGERHRTPPPTEEGEARSADVANARRLVSLMHRARAISLRARDVVIAAQESMKPVVERAVSQGKQRAAEVEASLRIEMDEAGDRPALAEIDETAPGSDQNKRVE